MRSLFILSLILVSAFTATLKLETQILKDLFEQWKITNDKVYASSLEEETKFATFTENYLHILEFNALNEDVTLGLNNFADLSNSEFEAMYTGLTPSAKSGEVATISNVNDLPIKVDWREKGAVTPVKNQGRCGSCWAFSAVGALEGLNFINNGELLSLAEQNLVDCVTGESHGCDGGVMQEAFDYTAKNEGIEDEATYPYEAKNGQCQFDKSKANKINSGYKNVPANSAEELKGAIAQQPVSVAIQADGAVFRFYKTGVISRLCGANLNHGVLAVGYDTFGGKEAFIVKNSWGTVWGNQGFVHISTDATANDGKGVCGILADASYPTK